LTPTGKELANNLDDTAGMLQRQPKLSLAIIVQKLDQHHQPVFLFQQRQRNPYFGFWSCIGGPVVWGEEAEVTAAKELDKQTGIAADCKVRGFYRLRDFDQGSGRLLEDKLFTVMQATETHGDVANTWHGGHNMWMTLDEFQRQGSYFEPVVDMIEMVQNGTTYSSGTAYYSPEQY